MDSNHIVIENKNKLFSWCSNNNVNIEEIMKVIDDIYSKLLSFDDKDFSITSLLLYLDQKLNFFIK